jgi:primosomal protein N' (replication factor Y)
VPEPLIARVLPDVSGLHKTFDYVVPEGLVGRVEVGSVVRVPLHGRRVGGWVVALGGVAAEGVTLKPLAKVTGFGPAQEVLELATWAAWRWAGPERVFLTTASAPGAVAALPAPARPSQPVPAPLDALAVAGLDAGHAVVRLPPAADRLPVVLAAAARGDTLVVTPSVAEARLLAARLRRSGLPVALAPRDWGAAAAGSAVVVGARAAVWAPMPRLAAVVVLDEHDERLQEERAPTWHARDVAIERARRAGVPCVLVSPCPTLEAMAWAPVLTPSRVEERSGWPVIEVIDRSRDAPWETSLVTSALLRHVREGQQVVVVLNTKGQARLLACASCSTLARCEVCEAALHQPTPDHLSCARCGAQRPVVCRSCGAGRFKALRPGVSRLRDDLAAAVAATGGGAVVEVTAATAGSVLPEAAVYVGTEAALHQVPAADAVAFVDFDSELLAPRYRSGEQAFALLARAARLVGGRAGSGRLLVQTRLPRHEVIQAALLADPGRLAAAELARRQALGFPPVTAMAAVSGVAAPAFIDGFGRPPGVEVLGPADGRWLLRAASHRVLGDALAAAVRPPGRLRIEVDPLRV